MSSAPRIRFLRIFLVLVILGGLGWVGWWFFGEVHGFFSSFDRSLTLAVITAFLCAIILAIAVNRAGASRATRLRGRADAYEAALEVLLRPGFRPVNPKEWRRIRARIVLWGSPRVLQLFTALEDEGLPLPLGMAIASEKLEALIRAMRADLGQIGTWVQTNDDSDDAEEEEDADEPDESTKDRD